MDQQHPQDPAAAKLTAHLRELARTGAPCLSVGRLADLVDRGETWVERHLKKLQDAGVLVIERRANGGRRMRVDGAWTDWTGGWKSGRKKKAGPPPIPNATVEKARRHLMSRDHVIVGAGPGAFNVNGKVRTTEELLAMANRSLQAMGRPPLVSP
ncbi:hypothetical protein [Azospirillum argentinense]|uniref:Uncharacterized protein n=1 Tax=Azospirillum brasilense TaxID=192 RepID=A0A4D8QCX3_AZOBR|nr:hypothetical protein [Azospirillum argentinense]QCO07554.1 hypothetical protein D3867_37355 [Azospirillum argentinense]